MESSQPHQLLPVTHPAQLLGILLALPVFLPRAPGYAPKSG